MHFSLAISAQGNADVDSRTARWPGVDGDVATDEAKSFPHADQTQPASAGDLRRVETGPVIDDPQAQRICALTQHHAGLVGAAVLDDIPEGFLYDAIEAQGHLLGYRFQHVVSI